MDGNDAHRALTVTAKAGYLARGAVYAMIGGLVVWSCVHGGGGAPGSPGALDVLAEAPLGKTALYSIAAGLVGYAIWR